jgi:hypothetical protein
MSKATLADKRVQELVDEICGIVRERFPEVEFQLYEGDDPGGVYIHAYADIEDATEMLRLVSERMAEIVEEEGMIIGLIPCSKKGRRAA